MEGSSIFTSAAVGDSKHELGDSEDALGEYKSPPKIHNPFRLYDNFRKGCTNVLTNQRGLKGSNGFRNNGGHPNHHSQCYEVADAQASLASSSIQITSIKPRRLNSEADSSDSSNSADDITISQVIKVKSQKHRDSDSSNFSSSNEDNSYPQPIGDFSKEIFSSRTQVPIQQPGAQFRKSLGLVASRDLPIRARNNSLNIIFRSAGLKMG